MNELTIERGVLAGAVAALNLWLGHLAVPLYVLVLSSVMDYVTGLLAAKYRGQKVSSYRGMEGIAKKVMMLFLVGVGWMADQLIAYTTAQLGIQSPVRCVMAILVAAWLTVNECISILENMQDMGVELPSWLLPMIQNLRSKIDKNAGQKKTGEQNGKETDDGGSDGCL